MLATLCRLREASCTRRREQRHRRPHQWVVLRLARWSTLLRLAACVHTRMHACMHTCIHAYARKHLVLVGYTLASTAEDGVTELVKIDLQPPGRSQLQCEFITTAVRTRIPQRLSQRLLQQRCNNVSLPRLRAGVADRISRRSRDVGRWLDTCRYAARPPLGRRHCCRSDHKLPRAPEA